MIGTLLQTLRPWGPLFFGVGFLAPLIATLIARTGLSSSLQFSSVVLGFAIGAAWGLYAKLRGSWL